jgi:hypothetical protein
MIPKVRHYGRIDKSELTFGEPVRIRDRKWLDTFEHKECMNCGKSDGTTVGAHIRWGLLGGVSLKPSDDCVAALCHACHVDQEASPGPEWWARCFLNYCRRLYARWKQSNAR